MAPAALKTIYRSYISCLNARDWARLGRFIDQAVIYNGRPIGLTGYQEMLQNQVLEIPDLRFEIEMLVTEPPDLAARLRFDCTPAANFLGLPAQGRRITFCENVFYRFDDDRIAEVWSIVDKAAIEAQLANRSAIEI